MKAKTPFLLLLGFTWLLVFSAAHAQDGTLDVTYGSGGRVLLPQAGSYTGPFLALDAQNRTVVCASVGNAFYATRLLPNGQKDITFGTAGVAVGQPEPDLNQEITFAMALPGNKTLIVLNVYAQDTLDETRILVLDATGKPDASFGNNGVVRLDLNPGAGEEYLYGGAVQPDGKIVLTGIIIEPNLDLPQGLVLRFNPNGTPDATFNGNGRVNAPALLFVSFFSSIILQPDGKMVVAGATADLATQTILGLLLRLNSNGQLDATFGTAGVVRLSALSSRFNLINDIARAADGKFVLVGTRFPQADSLRVLRLNANGSVDNTFGANGIASFFPAGTQATNANKCRVQADGKIVVLALALIDSTTFEVGYVLGRLNNNGQRDASFGSGGFVVQSDDLEPADLALQADGKILVGGSYFLPTDDGFFVHRYNNTVVSAKEARLDLGSVRLFPNPAREQTTVQFDIAEPQRLQIDLLDLHGRTVAALAPMRAWETGANALLVELPSLTAGLYWLRFRDENGRTAGVPLTIAPR
ncbi:MAG: T9SS type A sorting domain-containing protein [Saprospiraceae bacterium]|nr:T9SS type A sorting domain-containing protein [Saprospiraceae bacterium]MDW8229977.1 T9SS type A sorting domain-containing protein [Saprospiraceae bacterium]